MKFYHAYKLEDLYHAKNAAEVLSEGDRSALGNDVMAGYRADKGSRAQWEEDMAAAMKLTLQVVDRKTQPWDGASNVKFPLVTIAALQFHARVYPILVPGVDLVKCRVIGKSDPQKISRASRVATHMSWQLLEQDAAWEEQQDKLLLVTGIMGNAFKKSIFDVASRYPVGELVSPADLVVNYWTKTTVDMAPRATHIQERSQNYIVEKQRRGFFFDEKPIVNPPITNQGEPLPQARQDRDGTTPPPQDDTTPITLYEQLCWYDLDGDGYKEPYVATVQEDGKLLRLLARWVESDVEKDADGQILHIKPIPIYTKYGLIPAPDGSFYDLGFGRLLGPINDSVNTALNQLFDAGTLSNYGGGFLGRGARFRGGQYTFKPQEWKQVDSPGDDLRKNIVPLPVREPSDVLFKLLGFLVNYGERIASANDLQVGENVGQNTPAETARTMNANGQRVLAGMYKRIRRAFRDEIRVRYELNKVYLPVSQDYEVLATGQGAMVYLADYQGPATDVRPAADPTMVDDEAKRQSAAEIMGMAYKLPNFNKYIATRRWLDATRTQDIDEVYPPPQKGNDIQMGPDPKMLEIQIKERKQQLDEQEFMFEKQQWQIEVQRELMDDMQQQQLVQAQIYELQSRATKELADAQGVATGHMVGILQTQMAGVENQIRMLELMNTKLQGRIDEKLGKLKIIEATVKTTGAIHGVKRKIEDATKSDGGSGPGEAGMAPTPTDKEASATLEGLGVGGVPVVG